MGLLRDNTEQGMTDTIVESIIEVNINLQV